RRVQRARRTVGSQDPQPCHERLDTNIFEALVTELAQSRRIGVGVTVARIGEIHLFVHAVENRRQPLLLRAWGGGSVWRGAGKRPRVALRLQSLASGHQLAVQLFELGAPPI